MRDHARAHARARELDGDAAPRARATPRRAMQDEILSSSGARRRALAPSSSSRASSKSLLNSMLGSGALAVPSCFAACGAALTTATSAGACLVCALSLEQMLYCANAHGAWSYEDLTSATLGRRGRIVAKYSIAALLIGVVVAYVNIVGDNFFTAASSGVLPAGVEVNRERVMAGVTFGVFLPLATFVKSEKRLEKVVGFGLATTGLFGLCLVTLAARRLALGDGGKSSASKTWDTSGLGLVLPIMVFNFAANVMVFPALRSSGTAGMSTSRVVGIANETMAQLLIFYVVTGACGYVAFGSSVNGNVLRNFGAESGWFGIYTQLVRFLYGCAICTGVPLLFISLREISPSLLLSLSRVAGRYTELVFDILVLYSCLRVSISVPNIQHVFGLIGSTTCSILTFILPGMMFLRTCPSSSSKKSMNDFKLLQQLGSGVRLSARALILFGVFIGIACTRSTLQSLKEEAEVVVIIQRLVAAQTFVRSRVQVYDRILTAAAKFRRIDAAEKVVSKLSQESKLSESVVKDATSTLALVSNQETRSALMREFDSLNPFRKDVDEEDVREAKEKLTKARESYKNVSDTLREVRETLRDIEEEGKASRAESSSDDVYERSDEALANVRATDDALEETSDVLDLIEGVDTDVDRLQVASERVEMTDTIIEQTLEDLREAKKSEAEAVLQAATDVVEETKDADKLIENLKEPVNVAPNAWKKGKDVDDHEDIVEKIVAASNKVTDEEAERAVETVLQNNTQDGASSRAVQRASEILKEITTENPSDSSKKTNEADENVVFKKFVNATTEGRQVEQQ